MSLEKEVRKRNKKANLQKVILQSIVIGGAITAAILIPNVLWALKKMGILPHARQNESILSSRKRLLKNGLIKCNEKGLITITPVGRKFLARTTLLEKSKEKKKWDGKWRILIFDIPENKRLDREHIRYTLISIGFIQLQKSVWIYPYDCEDLVNLLKADLEIGKNVLYMIVEALEYDKPIRKHFGFKTG